MVRGYAKGTVTVFMSLLIVMILSLILSLVEMVHLVCVSKRTDLLIDAAASSIMAEYNRLLWKDYGILAVDLGYGSSGADVDKAVKRSLPYMDGRCSVSFIGVDMQDAAIDGYRLLSDQNGMVMVKDASIQETLELPGHLISDMTDLCNAGETAMSNAEDIDELLDQGEAADAQADALWAESQRAAAEAAAASSGDGSGGETVNYQPQPRPGKDVENPAKVVKEWKKKALLSQVIPEEAEVSGYEIDKVNSPSVRGLNDGTISDPISHAGTDRILYPAYLKNHFGNYTDTKDHGGMKYEWEYVLCGRDTDGKNLEEMVAILLACRSAENLISIRMDQAKMTEAEGVALSIVGWTGNEGIVNAVKMSIVAAWAYMESVLDVRLLLTGGRVPLIKSNADWTSQLSNLGACMEVHTKARESEIGLSYEEYLLIFSFMHPLSEMGLRSLDILEDALHQHPEYALCDVDQMACEIDLSASFSADPIFASLLPVTAGQIDGYEFLRRKNITYLTPVF